MKTWFITGTSSGMGRLLTEKALQRGDRVAATLRKPDALNDLKDTYSENLWVATLDVTDTTAVRRVVDTAFKELGRIDYVVNNAGYGLVGPAEELPGDQIRQQLDTNLVGSIEVIRAVLPHLRAQGGGRILQFSSDAGQVASPNFSVYNASKWGIEGFVEATALEVAPFNIELTLIEPGPTKTDFLKGLVSNEPSATYQHTPAGDVHRMLEAKAFPKVSDAGKVVDAIIASTGQQPAPKRLTLGEAAYGNVHKALTERLAALEAQKAVAFAVDA